MKTPKSFKVGDKVFAKVKGYPAWPAQVVGLSGKKYDVKFYGTGESGCLKPEDLFYYLKHKSQFIKTIKRKDYSDAVDEIEEEISSIGTDGNPVPTGNSDGNEKPVPETKKGVKRKRSTSISPDILNQSKISGQSSQSLTDNQVSPKRAKRGDDKAVSKKRTPLVTKEDSKDVTMCEDKVESDEVTENKDEVNKEHTNKEQTAKEAEEFPKDQVEVKDGKAAIIDEKESEELDENKKSVEVELPENAQHSEKGFEKDSDTNAKSDEQEVKNETVGNRRKSEQNVVQRDDASSVSEQTDDCDSGQFSNSEVIQGDVPTSDVATNELDDIRLIPDIHLTTLIIYAQHIRDKQDFYKAKAPDSGNLDTENDAKTKVLAVKLPTGKFVGIKFSPKKLSEFSSEYDRAMDDEKLAKEVLELKMNLEEGKQDAMEGDERLVLSLKSSENDIYQMVNRAIIDYKKEKLKFLQAENELFDRIVNIKRCLALDMARSKSAILHLEAILLINVTAFSLKKHPNFVETIRRLRRYIGNPSCWHLDKEELAVFTNDAKMIRELADSVFVKFKALFPYKDDEKFIDKYTEECEEFKSNLKDLTEAQRFSLCAEPYSRRALLDQIYDDLKPEENHKQEVDKGN